MQQVPGGPFAADKSISKAAQKAVELGYTNVYNAWDGTKEHDYKF